MNSFVKMQYNMKVFIFLYNFQISYMQHRCMHLEKKESSFNVTLILTFYRSVCRCLHEALSQELFHKVYNNTLTRTSKYKEIFFLCQWLFISITFHGELKILLKEKLYCRHFQTRCICCYFNFTVKYKFPQ